MGRIVTLPGTQSLRARQRARTFLPSAPTVHVAVRLRPGFPSCRRLTGNTNSGLRECGFDSRP